MFETIGMPELLIILAVVVLLFGAGRMSRLGKDLGTSVKEFRRAIRDDEDAPPVDVTPSMTTLPTEPEQPAQIAAPPPNNASGPQIF